MPPFTYSLLKLARGGKSARSTVSSLLTRSQESTASELLAQLSNPTDILSVLLIIGGDIVQKALAQMTGHTPAPVCFSFGWVSYSFMSMVNLLGDGRLMPPPDYPCKVVNMASGYFRENKNWVIGRLLRDNEAFMAKKHHGQQGGRSLRISIYRSSPLVPKDGSLRILHLLFTLVQFGISSIPWIMHGDWTTFLITGFGTLMATITGILPQWRTEKFPARCKTNKIIAITSGNGSKDIMIVRNIGRCMDLERLSVSESPRSIELWERSREIANGSGKIYVKTFFGLPLGFWFTRCICAALTLGWLTLLILVAGIQSNTWYLLIVGAVGMFQNAFVAGLSLHPEGQAIPLIHEETIFGNKVMDALMDLEVALEKETILSTLERDIIVEPLLSEYFPGRLRRKGGEDDWWKGDCEEYDRIRFENRETRGIPRSYWAGRSKAKKRLDERRGDAVRSQQDYGIGMKEKPSLGGDHEQDRGDHQAHDDSINDNERAEGNPNEDRLGGLLSIGSIAGG